MSGKILTVAKFEWLKHLRRKRFYAGIAVTTVTILLITSIYEIMDLPGKMGVTGTPGLFLVLTIGFGSYIPVLFGIFFSGDAIASEFDQKTGYNLFPIPVKRESIVIGKFLACFLATGLIIGLAYGLTAGISIGLYGGAPTEILESFGLALTFGASLVGITFLFSSLFKGTVGSTVAPFMLFFFVFEMISSTLASLGQKPWFLVNFAGRSVTKVFPLSQKGVEALTGGGGGAFVPPDPSTALPVLLAYCLIPLALSVLITKRKQLA